MKASSTSAHVSTAASGSSTPNRVSGSSRSGKVGATPPLRSSCWPSRRSAGRGGGRDDGGRPRSAWSGSGSLRCGRARSAVRLGPSGRRDGARPAGASPGGRPRRPGAIPTCDSSGHAARRTAARRGARRPPRHRFAPRRACLRARATRLAPAWAGYPLWAMAARSSVAS